MPVILPTFCLAAEAQSDAAILRQLCDNEIATAHKAPIGTSATWQGRTAEPQWYCVKNAAADVRFIEITPGRRLKLQPDGLNLTARKGRELVLVFKHRTHDLPPPDALVIHLDEDRTDDWVADLTKGFEKAAPEFPVVLAAPVPETEAWYLWGFQPVGPKESAALQQARKLLSFSPVDHPERLTSTTRASTGERATRDCKVVLNRLIGGDSRRLQSCLDRAVARSASEADGCGLGDFLRQVREKLVVLVGE